MLGGQDVLFNSLNLFKTLRGFGKSLLALLKQKARGLRSLPTPIRPKRQPSKTLVPRPQNRSKQYLRVLYIFL